jgi:UDP-glucuronate 4-epimerase
MTEGKVIRVFNFGNHQRDFTYVDDIVQGVFAVALHDSPGPPETAAPATDPATSSAPFRIYNIGNSSPVKLMDFLKTLEHCLGVKARLEMVEAQPGDVLDTWADCSDLNGILRYWPRLPGAGNGSYGMVSRLLSRPERGDSLRL